MKISWCLFVSLLTTTFGSRLDTISHTSENAIVNYTFPDGFLLGSSTAAYQIEGGWNEDGKGVSIWDTLVHTHPEYINNQSNGDVACDSYHKYKQDVQLLKEMQSDFYRFSISWTRILPEGHINKVNQAGIDYYNSLIDELLANGIQPVVTMFHWDLPQTLQDLGGWPNVVMVDYFEDYARLLFSTFGDRVKLWSTFNEPASFVMGYTMPYGFPPCVGQPGVGDYLAAHTVILSHARVYHMYNEEFRDKQQGKISIALNVNWCEPLTNSTDDIDACERHQQFTLGLYAHPIFSEEGDYPTVVKERVAQNSAEEGYTRSRLPVFTQEEIEYIRGTADFFAVNHYTTYLGTSGEEGTIPSIGRDTGVITTQDPEWPAGATSTSRVVPWGFRKQLNWIAKEYNNPNVFVTENGFSDVDGTINDTRRIDYITSYLTELLKAIHLDGCSVTGYSVWSLIDNFEWNLAYTVKFGLYNVDFNDPDRTRTAKESSKVYGEIIRTRQIPERFRPGN
ncbi:myrosinase 1-like [Periplaneta americana]|uniref:myrosinase 1-like n=1 Tax=Periplaneta americana TaxID=6978 RepID=UPI0037E8F0E7